MAFYHRAYWSLRCRDPIAVIFLSQGWVNIPRLWKTFLLQFQYLVLLRSVIFFLLVSSLPRLTRICHAAISIPISSVFPCVLCGEFAPRNPPDIVEACGL